MALNHSLLADWYTSNVGGDFEMASVPELYHHYVGHDNNRDWYMLTQVETQAVTRQLYHNWFPQIVYNQHQSSPFPGRIWMPPFADPVNPNLDPLLVSSLNQMGHSMRTRFDIEGKTTGSMKTLIEGLFKKERLLAYVRSFILFEVAGEAITKKGAKYHQFFAVRLAAERAVRIFEADRAATPAEPPGITCAPASGMTTREWAPKRSRTRSRQWTMIGLPTWWSGTVRVRSSTASFGSIAIG